MKDIIETLGLNGGHMIYYAITLVVLFVGLYLLLYRPVKRMIRKRKESLEAIYQENDKLNQEALEMKDEYQKKLEETRMEVARISAQATEAAEQKAAEVVAEAQVRAQMIVKNAKQEADSERYRLKEEFKQQVETTSMEVATAVLQREFKLSDNDKLIDEALTKWEKL